ncbi:MAG: dTDP-glucose 4,6-dehydratase [Clostridiales bacterium]|nr:dTDP-glucose 4,6-dehydratase [Clostridiales bacterium]
MRLLVTGGAGFIGVNFINYMRNTHPDYCIICLDQLTYAGRRESLAPLFGTPDFCFYQADICDRSAVEEIFAREKPDAVVNFAAESHVDRSILDPGIFLKTNILGVGVLMDACLKYGVKRFHQVSTDEVYGDLPLDRPELKFQEHMKLNPSSPYSASKASADLMALSYARTFQLPVTISRCSNNYGPYQFPEKLIPRMILRAMNDQLLPVYGQGLNVRDWVHVLDHCRGIDAILQKGRIGEIYHIGGHCELRNIDLVRLILKSLGKPDELIQYVADRKGHDLRYAMDTQKSEKELGWKPQVSFAKGMEDTIRWYLENQSWWAPLVESDL